MQVNILEKQLEVETGSFIQLDAKVDNAKVFWWNVGDTIIKNIKSVSYKYPSNYSQKFDTIKLTAWDYSDNMQEDFYIVRIKRRISSQQVKIPKKNKIPTIDNLGKELEDLINEFIEEKAPRRKEKLGQQLLQQCLSPSETKILIYNGQRIKDITSIQDFVDEVNIVGIEKRVLLREMKMKNNQISTIHIEYME